MPTSDDQTGQRKSAGQPDNTFWHSLIDESDAAEFIGFTVRCLQGWRYRGGGPPFYRVGGRIRYKRLDLARYAEQRQQMSTSDTAI